MPHIKFDETFYDDLAKAIVEYSDNKLIEILKMRSQYDSRAAQMAIKEAIKRNLINSELDLMAEEYAESTPGFQIFPPIEKPKTRMRVIKSLARSVLLVGVIPLVFGLLQINGGEMIVGVVLVLLGAIWIFSSLQILRKNQRKFADIVILMVVISIFYVATLFFNMQSVRLMDLFIVLILYGLVLYCLFYIRSLLLIQD